MNMTDARTTAWLLLALLLAGLAAPPVNAEEGESEVWEKHPHHLSVITGGTHDHDETAFTLGLDYEYRVNRLLGLGTVAEYAFHHLDSWTILAVADVHVWRGLALQTGPGIEIVDEDEGHEEEFVYRAGLLYEFELPRRFTVSPQVHYDVGTGINALVFGLAVGVNF